MTRTEEAFAAIERDVRRGKPPSRHDLRTALIAIGEEILGGREDAAAPWIDRLAAAREASATVFDDVVREEMALACTEHARGCDPRYLDHPRYDFAYTVEARHRLEARFRALELLELGVDDELLESVARADRLLAPRIARLASGEKGNRSDAL